MNRIASALSALALGMAMAASPALANPLPVLRGDITVNAAVVTVGDLFTDAGALASTPLFRAPRPGTQGDVSLDLITQMADQAGLGLFDAQGRQAIAVARAGSPVPRASIETLLADTLKARGLVPADATLSLGFTLPEAVIAAPGPSPLSLGQLTITGGGSTFAATLAVDGQPNPLEVRGTLALTALVPHLTHPVAEGTVLGLSDLDLRPIPYAQLAGRGAPTLDALIGKALRRAANSGVMVTLADITEPLAVRRGSAVRVLYRLGPMTLALSARALSDAAAGDLVRVLNPVSNKIIAGTATATGEVELGAIAAPVATAALN